MKQSSHDEGYRRFRKAMQDGALKPGMIVSQSQLCSLLGMSLTPLRETLVLLEEFGLVEVKARAGVTIVYPEFAFIRENYQFRRLIELSAIQTFVAGVDKAWVVDFQERHKSILSTIVSEEFTVEHEQKFLRLDWEMHMAFVASLHNGAIARVYDRIMDNIKLARQMYEGSAVRQRTIDSINEHFEILKGIERGDIASAAASLESHFQASTYRTLVAA